MKNEVLHAVKEKKNVLRTVKSRNTNWIGHILRGNCILKHVIEGRMEGTRRRRRRHLQLLDDLKVKRRYWNRKKEAIDHTWYGELSLEKAVDLAEDNLRSGNNGDAPRHTKHWTLGATPVVTHFLMQHVLRGILMCGGIQRRLVKSGYSRVCVFTGDASLTKHGNTLL